MQKQLWAILIGLLIGLWAVAVQPFLPAPLDVNPLLPLVIIALIASGRSRAYAVTVAGGILMDVYAIGAFDAAALRWMLVVFVLDTVMRRWLTDRSLTVAIGLVIIGRLIERGSAWLFVALQHLFSSGIVQSWNNPIPFWRLIVSDALLVAAGFMVLAFMTKRLLVLVPHGGTHDVTRVM